MDGISPTSNSLTGSVNSIPQLPSGAERGPPTQGGEGGGRGAFEHESQKQTQDELPATQNAFSSQFDMASSSPASSRQGPYNMAPLTNALPLANYRHEQCHQGHRQRYDPSSSLHMVPQMPPVSQYMGHSPMSMTPQAYYVQQPHIAQYYAAGQLSPNQAHSTMPSRQSFGYFSNDMMMNHPQTTYYYPQPAHYPAQHQSMSAGMADGHHQAGNFARLNPSAPVQYQEIPGMMSQPQRHIHDDLERRKSAVRGPPRKPRQNGHAVWIGNLPLQTDLMSLVHHVSKETTGLGSLFLISKSNCAFANYKGEEFCAAAQQKLHESKFQSVRLVSRLRKSAAEGTTGLFAPTGPAADTASLSRPSNQTRGRASGNPGRSSSTSAADPLEQPMVLSEGEGSSQQDRFFVLKSLTLGDLELSVRTSVWATQSHNEEILNNAFKECENVYLVFSANKSGEYFGYARMTSEINQDPKAAIKFAPTSQATEDLDLPKAILTGATEYIPKGRIVRDLARGTIFWEIEQDDLESGSDDESGALANKGSGSATEEEEKISGKPFNIEWLSTSRLPFYRTRGLRNPWNSNREVKIARDGTEVEPSVGRKLIGLFNRVQSPRPAVAMRSSIGTMPGFQQMPPYGQ